MHKNGFTTTRHIISFLFDDEPILYHSYLKQYATTPPVQAMTMQVVRCKKRKLCFTVYVKGGITIKDLLQVAAAVTESDAHYHPIVLPFEYRRVACHLTTVKRTQYDPHRGPVAETKVKSVIYMRTPERLEVWNKKIMAALVSVA